VLQACGLIAMSMLLMMLGPYVWLPVWESMFIQCIRYFFRQISLHLCFLCKLKGTCEYESNLLPHIFSPLELAIIRKESEQKVVLQRMWRN
jgi:hypothetical protein